MTPFAQAVDTILGKLAEDAKEQLAGVPSDDLNTWKPEIGLQDINTFFALTTHLVSAGEYWILHAAGKQPSDRDRPAEFVATGDVDALLMRMDRWRADSRAVLATLTDADLGRPGDDARGWTVAECILHAVEHTGVHVGHLQIQRQLWNAERAVSREP